MTVRFCLIATFIFLFALDLHAQVKIHSHNDYEHEKPFYEAMQAKVYSLEADVFLFDKLLCVAHNFEDIDTTRTIDKLYLQPLFNYCVRTTPSKKKMPVLMIDIKQDQQQVLSLLLVKFKIMQDALSKKGIREMPLFVISGDRPTSSSFVNFPFYVKFDGRPFEDYDKAAFEKIAFISDQYLKYSSWKGEERLPATDSANLVKLVKDVHKKGKPLRLWNTPDTPLAWKTFHRLGIDIINTDQPVICSKVLNNDSSK